MLLNVDRQKGSCHENENRSRHSRQQPKEPCPLEGPAREIEFRSHFDKF